MDLAYQHRQTRPDSLISNVGKMLYPLIDVIIANPFMRVMAGTRPDQEACNSQSPDFWGFFLSQ